MNALLKRAGDINLAALVCITLMFLALLAGGANSASAASLLSLLLCAMAALTLLASPRAKCARLWSDNWLSAGAFLVFLGLALASATPLANAWTGAHPAWAAMGVENGASALSPYRALEGAAAFAGAGAAFVLGALLAPDSRARDWSGRWLVLWSLIYTAIGLYLYFGAQARPGGRLDVAIGSANAAAMLFALCIFVAAVLIVRGARGRLGGRADAGWIGLLTAAPLSLASALVLFGALLLTASRGALAAFCAALVLFLIIAATARLRSANARAGFLAAPLLVLTVLFGLFFLRGGDEVIARLALAGEDAQVRRIIAETHWAAFLQRPLFGHGLNAYHELNALSANPGNWRAIASAGSAHNIFIQALEETGIVGLGLFALMLLPLIGRAIIRIGARAPGADWALGALAITALVLLHGLVDFGLQVPAIAALYAFILGVSLGRSARRA
ncbi:MAG: O-antigen ligase family protein [Hyphomonadaceae bacterium]|nr:O-antigen ligase family protein [Hyphomonadaceae bacterium]